MELFPFNVMYMYIHSEHIGLSHVKKVRGVLGVCTCTLYI